MTTALQSDGQAWRDIRHARFTASTVGDLFAEPKTLPQRYVERYGHLVTDAQPMRALKSGPRKGLMVPNPDFAGALREKLEEVGIPVFGQSAMRLIAQVAGQYKYAGAKEQEVSNRSMDRGTVLEHAARYLLDKHWQPIAEVRFQANGEDAGASPDGILQNGEPWECKCPEDYADLILFDQEVADGDHEAMEAWNRDWYWQGCCQAHWSGAEAANIVLFTDRLPVIPLQGEQMINMELNPDAERNICQHLIDYACERLNEQRPWGFAYEFSTDGWWYVARRFPLTDAIRRRIDTTIKAAVSERDRMVQLLKPALSAQPQ